MKTIRILTLVLLVFGLIGCDVVKAPRQVFVSPGGDAPQAWIDAPLDGMQIPLAPYEFVAHGSDDAGIRQLEWTLNDAPLGISPAEGGGKLSTFRWMWSPPVAGQYTLKVRAQNGADAWSDYDEVTFLVGDATGTPTPAVITITPTATPTPVITDTPTTTATTTATTTVTVTPTLIPAELTFSPGLSSSVLYFGSCQPNSVDVSVQLSNTANVKHVELYLRLLDQNSSDSTKWDSYSVMIPKGDGLFRTLVKSSNIPGADKYSQATVLYQFIVIDTNGKVMTRSDSFNDLSLSACAFFIRPGVTLQPVLIPSKTPIIIK